MEKNYKEPVKSSNGKRLIIGLLFLLFGFMFMTRHMPWFPPHIFHFIFQWEVILIAIGLLGLIFGRNTSFNLVIILIGSFFLLGDIYHFPFEFKRLILPFILIFIGLMMIFHRGRPHGRCCQKSTIDSDDYIDDVAVFGGGSMNVVSENFKGGKITSIFGGSEINLLASKLADGKNVIDVFHIFGGSKLLIPADWSVRIDVISIFGGYVDKRKDFTDASKKENKMLYIKGMVIFGGGEINNF